MVFIGSALGDEIFDAARGTPKFSCGQRSGDLEFGESLDGGSFLIVGRAIFASLLAGAIDEDFVAVVLAAGNLGQKDAVVAVGGTGAGGCRLKEDERFIGAHGAYATQSQGQIDDLARADDAADVGRLRLDSRPFTGDGDLL